MRTVRKMVTGRISWIEHEGIKILSMDFSHARVSESIAMMDEYIDAVANEQGPIYMFTDVSAAEYDSTIAAKWKAVRLEHGSMIRASAIIGLAGLVGMAIRAFMQLSEFIAPHRLGGPIRIFESRAEALKWLVEQSKA